MDTATSTSELRERRKMVRIRLRSDLDIAPQKYEGRTYYVVKDPVSMRYYRFKEQEHFLLQYMDGRRTLDQAQKEFEKRFRPERLTLEDLEQFAQQLLQVGLAQNETPQAGKQLFDRRKKRRRSELMQYVTNILYIKIPVFDPDKLLQKMMPFSWWIFTTTFLLLSVAVMLSSVMLVLTNFEAFRARLPSYEAFFSFKTVINLWIALGVVKVIHEFGHGLSCKAFGGEVHEMGALFLVFSPCLYCNVSDAWTLPSKWKRIIISFAGIYVEFMIAAIAAWVWWNSAAHPWINNLSLALMIVCSVSTFVFNANPLMRYDGYYILADWLEIPNLRDRSNRFLKHLVMEHCLGIEVPPEQYMALGRKWLFVIYAIISYIYRWVVTYAILIFMYGFLKPYGLERISQMLAIGAFASMVGWPLYRLGKNLHKRGRLPDMKPVRATISAAVVLAVVVIVFTVPLPVGRVRDTALVELPAGSFEDIPVPMLEVFRTPVVLQQVYVRDGQHVREGEVLAEFSNLELENRLTTARAEHASRVVQLAALREADKPSAPANIQEQSALLKRKAQVEAELKRYATETQTYEDMKKELVVKAPRTGVVISPPRPDDQGKQWNRDQGPFFCKIGDDGAQRRLQVRLPVSPSDRDLIYRDTKNMTAAGDLDVDIRVHGLDSRVWKGKLIRLQESSADTMPEQLTAKGGGNVAVTPNSRPGQYKPQAQQFFAYIEFQDPTDAICPGTLAQVKVHCQWHTAAWWVWRTVNNTFDLKLL